MSERGGDVARTEGGGHAVTDKAMTVRLPPELADELELVTAVDDVPVAEAIRAAVAAHIETRRRCPHFQLILRDRIERMRALEIPGGDKDCGDAS